MKKKLKLLFFMLVVMGYPAILKAQIISTIAGTGVAGNSGDGGLAINAQFNNPSGVAIDQNGDVYVSEWKNHQVRKIDISTGIITRIAGTGSPGYSGDEGLAINAQIEDPSHLAFDTNGDLYISGGAEHAVRKVEISTGIITTVAGTGVDGFSGDGGLAVNAWFSRPTGTAWDDLGNLYIGDANNNRIRKVDAQTGIVTTIAGTGVAGDTGDGGPAINAQLNNPRGLKMYNGGELYFCDINNSRIRRIDLSTGIINTIGGTGVSGYSGDGGLATNAQFHDPIQVEVAEDEIYIADRGNNRIRKIDTNTGIVNTIAGTGVRGFAGDGGVATAAQFDSPYSIAVDNDGNKYVPDYSNNRIRRIEAPSTIPTINVLVRSYSGNWDFLTGGRFNNVRDAITNPANFGEGGTVEKNVNYMPSVTEFTSGNLSGVDVVLLPWNISTTEEEKTALSNFVNNGGGILAYGNQAGAELGFMLGSTDGGGIDGVSIVVSNPSSPIANGPFGSYPVGTTTGTSAGRLFGEVGPKGIVGITRGGTPFAATYEIGAGRVVAFQDEEMFISASLGGADARWNGTHNNYYLNSFYYVSQPSAVSIDSKYQVTSSTYPCTQDTFCVAVNVNDSVLSCLGLDAFMEYDPTEMSATGNVYVGSDLIDPSYTSYSVNTSNSGEMNISMYLNSSAPAGAKFEGIGEAFCVEFVKEPTFNTDSTCVYLHELVESYVGGVELEKGDSGWVSIYRDSLFASRLTHWLNYNPLSYDGQNPGSYLVTNVYGSDGSCENLASGSSQPNLSGEFSHNVNTGQSIAIQRDIKGSYNDTANSTIVMNVIGGMDASLTKKYVINDASFTPSIWQVLAMDVNQDGAVSAGDISQLNRRTVMKIHEFQQVWNYDDDGVSNGELSKDWIFVDSTRVADDPIFQNVDKLNVPQLDHCIELPLTNYPDCPVMDNENYVGILLGDVDGNFDAVNSGEVFRQSSTENVYFDLEKTIYRSGCIVDVPFYANTTGEVTSLDFEMGYDRTNLELIEIHGVQPKIEMLHNEFQDKLLFTSFSDKVYDKNIPVAYLRFSAKSKLVQARDFGAIKAFVNGKELPSEVKGVYDCDVVGIEEELLSNINIYPNPSTGTMFLETIEARDFQIEVYDLVGKQVFSQSMKNTKAGQRIPMNLSHLTEGAYHLKVNADKHQTIRKIVLMD